MSQKTKIEWCDATLSPWWGCTKVSDGCKNCYAETITHRFKGDHWGKGKPRLKQPNFAENALALDRKAKRLGKRLKVFPSMCDWLDEEVPIEWLADFLKVIHDTPNLDWLLLTKRPENFEKRIESAQDWHFDFGNRDIAGVLSDWRKHEIPFENVWLGVSVENQEQADKRIPVLLKIPAKIRFLSCEPLLGKVDLLAAVSSHSEIAYAEQGSIADSWDVYDSQMDKLKNINWTIVGGESGPKARPMHPDWARSIRDQCVAANVPFFFKQWGAWHPVASVYCEESEETNFYDEKRSRFIAPNGTIQCVGFQPQNGSWLMAFLGKLKSGRLLEGVEWNQFPDVIESKKVERV